MSALRSLGRLLLIGALAALAWKLLMHQEPAANPVEPPPGFSMPVEDFGQVGFGVRGPVRITLYREVEEEGGRLRALPRMIIEGRDPRPLEAEGGPATSMRLDQVDIQALGEDGQTELYRVEAPAAELALVAGAGRPTLDPARPWVLERPELRMPTPHGELVLATAQATLESEQRSLRGHGGFELRSGSMAFAGSELELDLETGAVDFGPEQDLSWQFPSTGDGLLRGSSDGGGLLREREDGSRSLELPAAERCEMELPAESGLEGRFRCGGLELILDPVGGGSSWTPRRAVAAAPSSWSGQLQEGRQALVYGEDAVLVWDGPQLHGIDQRGPMVAVIEESPEGAEGGWLAAEGGAYLTAGQRSLLLYGGVGGIYAGGWFEADSYFGDDGGWLALGNVSLADGMVLTDRFEVGPNGRKFVEGAVLFSPDPRIAVAAPRLVLQAPDELKPDFQQFHAEGGVRTHLSLQAQPAVLHSRELDAQGDLGNSSSLIDAPPLPEPALEAPEGGEIAAETPGARVPAPMRLDARHEVRIEQGEALFTGNHFAAHSETSMELRGTPAIGEIPRHDKEGKEIGIATLSALRLVLHESEVLPIGRPELQLPAAELGLAGEEIRVTAQRMRFQEDGSAGGLQGRVRAEGGLELEAWSAVWETLEDPGHQLLTLLPEAGKLVRMRGELLPEPVGADEGSAAPPPSEAGADRPAPAPPALPLADPSDPLEGRRFDFEARKIQVRLWERVGILDGDARVRVELDPGEEEEAATTFEVAGRHGEVGLRSGLFQHNATLVQESAAGKIEAGADRIEWRRDGQSARFELSEGRPWLKGAGLDAKASHMVVVRPVDPAAGMSLELTGSAERPASLQLPNGRVLTGARLRYNFLTRLYDTGSGRLHDEDDRP